MSYIVLARKYRPQTFEEIYAQEHITQILQNALNTQRIAHAYLFTGPRGVGKTSMARILAKSVNCMTGPTSTPCNECHICREITSGTATDVIEIDGASNTGVEDIRELQRELLYAPSQSKYKIYIIDEVHMLSKSAFNALLKTLEEPPENVIFIFATTEPQKVIATIISRCLRFDFKRIPVEDIVARLEEITTAEHIITDRESLYIIAQKADGSLRDALSLMDQVLSYCQSSITENDVRTVFGLLPTQVYCTMIHNITAQDSAGLITLINELIGKGSDIQELINGLLVFLRDLTLIKLGIKPSEVNPDNLELYQQTADLISDNNLMYMMTLLIQTKLDIKTSSNPILILEVTMIKLSRMSMMDDIARLVTELERLQLGAQTRVTEPQTSAVQPQPPREHKHAPSHPPVHDTPGSDAARDLLLPFSEASFTQIMPKLTDRMAKHSRLTATNLKECTIAGFSANTVEMRTSSHTGFNTLTQNQQLIDETASSFFTAPIKLRFIYDAPVQEQAATPAPLSPEQIIDNNPHIKQLVEELGFKVVDE